MKKLFMIVILVIMCSLLFTACEKQISYNHNCYYEPIQDWNATRDDIRSAMFKFDNITLETDAPNHLLYLYYGISYTLNYYFEKNENGELGLAFAYTCTWFPGEESDDPAYIERCNIVKKYCMNNFIKIYEENGSILYHDKNKKTLIVCHDGDMLIYYPYSVEKIEDIIGDF